MKPSPASSHFEAPASPARLIDLQTKRVEKLEALGDASMPLNNTTLYHNP